MISNVNHVTVSAIFLTGNLLTAFYSISQFDDSLHAENSLLENVQAICLAASAVGYLFLTTAAQNQRLVFMAVALLCFCFLLRELDLERLNVPYLVQILGSGPGRACLLASLWIAFICYALKRITSIRLFLKELVRSRMFLLLGTALGLLCASALMDKNVFGIGHARLFEELLEANAYLIIVLPLLSPATRFLGQRMSPSGHSDAA